MEQLLEALLRIPEADALARAVGSGEGTIIFAPCQEETWHGAFWCREVCRFFPKLVEYGGKVFIEKQFGPQ